MLGFSVFTVRTLSWEWTVRFVFDRSFSIYWGFLEPMYLLMWVPKVILFLIFGFSVYLLVRSRYPIYWSLGLGFAASAIFWLQTKSFFTKDAAIINYVYHYLEYLLAPVATYIGGIGASLLRTHVTMRRHRG